MYLDSSVGSWQMSKFMINTSQGAIGNTLNQLYMGKAYKVRLCSCSVGEDRDPPMALIRLMLAVIC